MGRQPSPPFGFRERKLSEFKVLIIDDEPLARQKILRHLKETTSKFPGALAIFEATNGIEGLEKIFCDRPDLIFLDIQMPGMTGMEMLQQLEKRPFKIVFATAYEEFALRAFAENACDYLLKPFDQKRFDQSLEKTLMLHSQEKKLEQLESSFRRGGLPFDKITYKVGDRVKFIPLSFISHFESREHYTYAHTADGEKLIDLSLSYLEKQVNGTQFTRIHRHILVSQAHIQEIKRGENMWVVLKNGLELPVSRNNRKKLLV